MIKTNWDLTLLYRSETDPQIEKDLKKLEKACTDFAKKYTKSTDYLKNEHALLHALADYETLRNTISDNKPLTYFLFRRDLDSTNKIVEGNINKITDRAAKATNTILFFTLSLSGVSQLNQKKFLASKRLAPFRYFLERVFLSGKYRLSEPEEKILNLKEMVSGSLWTSGVEKSISKKSVQFKSDTLSIPEAQNLVPTLPTQERRALHTAITEKLKEVGDFAESEINAIYTNKKIDDELRGYKEPYSETLIGHQTDEKTIKNLVDVVTKSFTISQRFYTLKAKLLGLQTLEYPDRNASIEKDEKEIDVMEGIAMVKRAFGKVSPQYEQYLNEYLENGQIDVYPHVGKRGGAYCWGGLNRPTFVLLNTIPKMDSFMTLGHEMGHAIHTEFSKKQPVMYQRYSTATAEVASTLFENFVFDEIFETLSDTEKISALHNHIQDDVQTIFRQIACFNFELAVHRRIRKDGMISKEDLAKLMNEHLSAYLGKSFVMKEDDGYQFISWAHLRYSFYTYSYAYGQLISKALYANYKKDKKFLAKIEQFLSAGGSKTPYQIFKDIGIDVSKPTFFEEGLQNIDADIDRLEQLTKDRKLV